MAELSTLESKLGEIMGLAQAAQESTAKVMRLIDDEEIGGVLRRMHDEAGETARRCEEVADELPGKKTAVRNKARETKSEAGSMMAIYLGGDADALDGLEFLMMAEAGELGHVEIARELDGAGNDSVRELIEWALPIQRRHVEDTREAALSTARQQRASDA